MSRSLLVCLHSAEELDLQLLGLDGPAPVEVGGSRAWLGLACFGLLWLTLAWLGLAYSGLAWLTLAWLGSLWLGFIGSIGFGLFHHDSYHVSW